MSEKSHNLIYDLASVICQADSKCNSASRALAGAPPSLNSHIVHLVPLSPWREIVQEESMLGRRLLCCPEHLVTCAPSGAQGGLVICISLHQEVVSGPQKEVRAQPTLCKRKCFHSRNPCPHQDDCFALTFCLRISNQKLMIVIMTTPWLFSPM